jgi:hypothetical protein
VRSSIDALSRAAGTDDGDWSLLHVRDNLVFATATRVAKMARHPDGRSRLVLSVASFDDGGVPVGEDVLR